MMLTAPVGGGVRVGFLEGIEVMEKGRATC